MVTYSTENPAFESTHSITWWIIMGFLVLWAIHAFAAPAHAAVSPLTTVVLLTTT